MKHGNAGAAGAQQDQQGGGLFGSLGSLAGMLGGAGALGGLGGLLGQLTGGGGNTDHAAVDAAAPGGVGPLQQILEQAGLGEQVRSWIGNGQNLPVSGEQITQALGGSGALSQLASTFGLNENEVASQLAEILPDAVNHLTPQARCRTPERTAPQTEKPAICGLFHALPLKAAPTGRDAQANE